MKLVHYRTPGFRPFGLVPGLLARSPWTGLESEIDRLFASTLADVGGSGDGSFPVDLYEDAHNTYVRAELPGVAREQIGVEVVEGYLNLNATRKRHDDESAEAISLHRSLRLPADTQADKVNATYEDGVLTVTLPKREEAKPKKIAVNVK